MPKLAYRSTLPRPSDPTIIEAVCSAIEQGEPMSDAAYSAGISAQTAKEWLSLGLQELNSAPPGTSPQEAGSHAYFALAVKEAEARFVRENLQIVRRDRGVIGKGWLPAMTLLERRRPQDFGRSESRYVKMDQRTLTISVTIPAAAESELLALLQGRLAAGDTPLLPAPADITGESSQPES